MRAPERGLCRLLRQLLLDWYFWEKGEAQANCGVERLQGCLETDFEPGRRFANHLGFQLQLDRWLEKATRGLTGRWEPVR